MKTKSLIIALVVFSWILSACQSAQIPSTATASVVSSTATTTVVSSTETPIPTAQQSSPSNDCTITIANYDLPHTATEVGGQELYDLAATQPTDTYLSVSATVTEAQHLVSTSDGVDGTLVFAYIGDLNGAVLQAYYLLIYLPDGGEAVSQLPVDSKMNVSGLYVGYVYPPKNLFTVFPNENEDTKFPSVKAEVASYGCP